jgi:hypothetical protein
MTVTYISCADRNAPVYYLKKKRLSGTLSTTLDTLDKQYTVK